MNAKTVKLALLRELVEAGSVRSAAIIGLPGGYAVAHLDGKLALPAGPHGGAIT